MDDPRISQGYAMLNQANSVLSNPNSTPEERQQALALLAETFCVASDAVIDYAPKKVNEERMIPNA